MLPRVAGPGPPPTRSPPREPHRPVVARPGRIARPRSELGGAKAPWGHWGGHRRRVPARWRDDLDSHDFVSRVVPAPPASASATQLGLRATGATGATSGPSASSPSAPTTPPPRRVRVRRAPTLRRSDAPTLRRSDAPGLQAARGATSGRTPLCKCINWGCRPADLLTNRTVPNPKVHVQPYTVLLRTL